MPFALVPLLLAAALLPQDPAEPPDFTGRTVEELIALVQGQRDRVDPGVFKELARRGDRVAFAALQRCSTLVASPVGLEPVFDAVADLARTGRDGVDDLARGWLADMSLGQSWAHQRPASRALASLGALAEKELRRVLRDSGDPHSKQLACGGLVPALELQGDEAALDLLLEWYLPPVSGPQARLVRALGAFDEQWAIERLGKVVRKNEWPPAVRIAAASALGKRASPAADEALLGALKAKDPRVQLAGMQALAERGDVGQARALEKLMRSRDEAVRWAAMIALDGLRAGELEWEVELARAIEGRDSARRLAAVELFSRRPGPASLAALSARLTDGSHLVRAAAIRALAPRREPSVVPLLIERMPLESLRVRAVLRDVLIQLTGRDHGPTAARWTDWWSAEGATFKLPPISEAAAANALRDRRKRENPTQAGFYGIPLGSDRVCFVIDTSGSMNYSLYTGGSRLEAAVKELTQAIERFPVGGRFNLVFFAGRVRPWKPALVEMRGTRAAQAIKYARSQRAKGGTALYDALLEALDDEEVDTIVVLSDGQPSEGKLTDPAAILADIDHRNQLRGVVFHCVALNHASKLLEGLAEASGGSYREVR
jgi:HEAT repeat protein